LTVQIDDMAWDKPKFDQINRGKPKFAQITRGGIFHEGPKPNKC